MSNALLLLLLAHPAWAGPAFDELRSQAPELETAVPAARPRPLAELGPEYAFEGIILHGSPEFVAKTRQALALLKKNRHFDEIKTTISAIREFACSGIDAADPRPTFDVGAPSWKADLVWYAGDIAHDSRHVQLFRAGQPWNGADAERAAMRYQAEVLKDLRAPQRYLDYLAGLEKDPRYQYFGPRVPPPGVPTRPPANDAERVQAECGTRSW